MPTTSTIYRLDKGHALQLFGWRMIFAAVLVFVTFVLLEFQGVTRVFGYLAAAVAVVLVLFAVWTWLRPPVVISLDEAGFHLGRIARAGIRSAPWLAVDEVEAAGGVLVLALTGGTRSSVPLGLVSHRADELKLEVHKRLNAANGYRRLD